MPSTQRTEVSWNPTRGCSHISPGCSHCSAAVVAARLERMDRGNMIPLGRGKYDGLTRFVLAKGSPDADGVEYDRREARWTGQVVFDANKLTAPLQWRRPRRVLVNNMSDLFHEDLTNEQIAAVFGVMAACPDHLFQASTKRTRRMRDWFMWIAAAAKSAGPGAEVELCVNHADEHDALGARIVVAPSWPLSNVELGASVENQDAADERIPDLLLTPAATRFIHVEPLLGPVDLHAIQIPGERVGLRFSALQHQHDDRYGQTDRIIDWVKAGPESGRGARSCDDAWLRALRAQCAAAGVPFSLIVRRL